MISPGFVLGRSLKNSVRSWDAVGIEGLYSVAGMLNEKVLHGCFGICVARLARLFCLCTASLIVTARSHGFEFVLASLRRSPHVTAVCNDLTELKSNNAMLLCPSPVVKLFESATVYGNNNLTIPLLVHIFIYFDATSVAKPNTPTFCLLLTPCWRRTST